MTLFLSEHDAARLGLADAKPRTTRGRTTRPDIPSAPRAAATGLSSLLAPARGSGREAWSIAYCITRGYRLYVIGQPRLDTGWHDSEAAACTAARGMGR